MSWEPPADSAAAMLDEQENLAKVASDLTANEMPRPPAKGHDRTLKLIGEFIGKQLAPLKARVAELEQKQLTLAGTWKPAQTYKEASLVSYGGGLWLSLCATPAPGRLGGCALKRVTRNENSRAFRNAFQRARVRRSR